MTPNNYKALGGFRQTMNHWAKGSPDDDSVEGWQSALLSRAETWDRKGPRVATLRDRDPSGWRHTQDVKTTSVFEIYLLELVDLSFSW
jgi:hypothetical protein